MPSSSRPSAPRDGISSPAEVRWFGVLEEENPMAPARMASRANCRISAISSSVAVSRLTARWPMTKTRNAE